MDSMDLITAITIDLTVDNKPSLHIHLDDDGFIKRKLGSVGPFHDDGNLYCGKIDNGLFRKLRSRIPEDWLFSNNYCENTSSLLWAESKLTIILQMADREDVFLQWLYVIGQEQSQNFYAFIRSAVGLTAPWVGEEKAKAGVTNMEPEGGWEYARELPPEGYEYRQNQERLYRQAKAKSEAEKANAKSRGVGRGRNRPLGYERRKHYNYKCSHCGQSWIDARNIMESECPACGYRNEEIKKTIYVSFCDKEAEPGENDAVRSLKDAFVSEAIAAGYEVIDDSKLDDGIALRKLKESDVFVAFINKHYNNSSRHHEDLLNALGSVGGRRCYIKKPKPCYLYEVGKDNSRRTVRPGYDRFDGTYRDFCRVAPEETVATQKPSKTLKDESRALHETQLSSLPYSQILAYRVSKQIFRKDQSSSAADSEKFHYVASKPISRKPQINWRAKLKIFRASKEFRYIVVFGILILFYASIEPTNTAKQLAYENKLLTATSEERFLVGRDYITRPYSEHYLCSSKHVIGSICNFYYRHLTDIEVKPMSSRGRGIFWLKKAATEGHAEAAYLLSEAYHPIRVDSRMRGKYPLNTGIALHYLFIAIKAGHTEANYKLGWFYLRGIGGIEVDLEKAEHYLAKASGDGNRHAEYLLDQINDETSK